MSSRRRLSPSSPQFPAGPCRRNRQQTKGNALARATIASKNEVFVTWDYIENELINKNLSYFTDNGKTIDEVLVSYFKSPASYTSEDVIEISCHGSEFIQQKIVEILFKNR